MRSRDYKGSVESSNASDAKHSDQDVQRPATGDPLGNLLGLLQHWGKEQPATVEEMDEAIRTRTAKKFERSFRVEE